MLALDSELLQHFRIRQARQLDLDWRDWSNDRAWRKVQPSGTVSVCRITSPAAN